MAVVMLFAALSEGKAQVVSQANELGVKTSKESTKWIPKDGNHTLYASAMAAYDEELGEIGGAAEFGYYNHRNNVPFRIFLGGEFYADDSQAFRAGAGLAIPMKAKSKINIWIDGFVGYRDQCTGAIITHILDGESVDGTLYDTRKNFKKQLYAGGRVEIELKVAKKFSFLVQGEAAYLTQNGNIDKLDVENAVEGSNIDITSVKNKLQSDCKKLALKGAVGVRLYF